MTKDEAKIILAVLNSGWAHRPLDAATASLWGAKLRRYDYHAVRLVVGQLMETSKFRPSLAEILAPIRTSSHKPASEAFADVRAQIGKLEKSVTDAEAETVRRLGGWHALGMWKLDEVHWNMKRFIEIYEDVVEGFENTRMRAIGSDGQKSLSDGGR